MKLQITAILKIIIQSRYNEYQEFATLCGISRQNLNAVFKQKDLLFITAHKMLSHLDYDLLAVKDNEFLLFNSAEESIQIVNEILKNTSTSKAELAKRLNVSYAAVMKFFKQPNLKVGTIVKIFNVLGYEVVARSRKTQKNYYIGDKDYWNFSLEPVIERTVERLTGENNMYIGAEQTINSFYQDCLEVELTSTISTMSLWDAFENYCRKNKHRGLPYKEFVKLFKHKAILNNDCFYGLKLKEIA